MNVFPVRGAQDLKKHMQVKIGDDKDECTRVVNIHFMKSFLKTKPRKKLFALVTIIY